jgi:hypothetical protein
VQALHPVVGGVAGGIENSGHACFEPLVQRVALRRIEVQKGSRESWSA